LSLDGSNTSRSSWLSALVTTGNPQGKAIQEPATKSSTRKSSTNIQLNLLKSGRFWLTVYNTVTALKKLHLVPSYFSLAGADYAAEQYSLVVKKKKHFKM